jgi:hypothetical protein
VNQFVPENVIRLRQTTRERHDDAALEHLRDAAGAFTDAALDRVRLAEVRPARIENERLPAPQFMVQQRRDARVPALRHARRELRRLLFLRIEVDVEVVRFQDLEIEVVVLDLVLSEVVPLCEQGRRREHRQGEHGNHHTYAMSHNHPVPAETAVRYPVFPSSSPRDAGGAQGHWSRRRLRCNGCAAAR